jgi:GMP synthase-like glutamine amidotransferase
MAHEAQLPVVGICLGHQLLAEALGGKVAKMPAPEVGFLPVSLTVPAQTEPVLAGLAWTMPQFHSHAYEVTQLPPGASLMASSKACKVQCFRAGMRSFGFQFHFESDQANIERRASQAGHLCALNGFDARAASAQFAEHGEMFSRLGDRLCVNLATLCFPMRSLTAV